MKRMQEFIMQSSRPWTKKLFVTALALTLFACSAARVGYNNGEFVSYWWLNSYVDFDSDQKTWVRQHIDELFAWHHKRQLRGLVQLASRVQHRDLATVSTADLQADYNEGKTQMLQMVDHAAPKLADLAVSLTPAQIDNIERKFAKNNRKFKADYLTGNTAERQAFRYKKLMKQAEYWFGDFSREQRSKLRALSDARPLNNELLLAERMRRQKELIAMLRQIQAEKPSRDATTTRIRQYVTDTVDYFGNRKQQAFAAAGNDANLVLVAAMMHMATPQQKRHFIDTLQDWISDFNRLSAEARS